MRVTDTTSDDPASSKKHPSRSAPTATRSRRSDKQLETVPTPIPGPSSIPTTDPADNNDVPELADIRDNLTRNPFFLGNPDISSHVTWVDEGRQLKLVSVDSAQDDIKKSALLQWVGEISPNNFWLYACAGWNGSRGPNDSWEKVSPFEKAKARATVRQPSLDLFAADWSSCLENLNRLMSTTKKFDNKTNYSLLDDEGIKIRHSIFEVRSLSESQMNPQIDVYLSEEKKMIRRLLSITACPTTSRQYKVAEVSYLKNLLHA